MLNSEDYTIIGHDAQTGEELFEEFEIHELIVSRNETLQFATVENMIDYMKDNHMYRVID